MKRLALVLLLACAGCGAENEDGERATLPAVQEAPPTQPSELDEWCDAHGYDEHERVREWCDAHGYVEHEE